MQHNDDDDDDDDIFSTFNKNNNIINNNIFNNKNNVNSNNKCSKSDKRSEMMTWPKVQDDDSSGCSSSGGSINSSKSTSSDDGFDARLDRRLTICEMHNYCSNKQNSASKYSQKCTQDDAFNDADYDIVDDGFDEFVTLSDNNLYDIDEKENDYNNYNNTYNNIGSKQNIEKYKQENNGDDDDDDFKQNNTHNYDDEKYLNRKTYSNIRSRPHPYKTSSQKSPSSPSRPRRRPRSPTYHPTFRGRKGIYRKSEEVCVVIGVAC